MAAKTLKEAVSQAFDKHEFIGTNALKLRQDILNEVRDYMAHEFMIYTGRVQRIAKSPDDARAIEDFSIGLFNRLFSSIPAFNTEKDANEKKKGG